MKEKKISVVVPVHSEEEVINEFYRRLKSVLIEIKGYDHEMIFVNDGSTDSTLEKLIKLNEIDPSVKVIDLSRNFGHQLAITSGIDAANGDAVVIIDGDLQDPPEVILKMVKKWEEGFNVVYGKRISRKGENAFKLFTANVFYRLIKSLSDCDLNVDAGDFRLMDESVVNSLKEIREESRYIRGLVSWIGFRQTFVLYERDQRYAGATKFTFAKMMKFAFDGIISFSEKPLYFAGYLGLVIAVFSFCLIIWVLVSKLLNTGIVVTGWASTLLVILFLGGVQLISIGIIGQYMGRIYKEVKKRPLYIVNKKIGFNEKS